MRDAWEDQDENERVTFKVEARRVGILPYRVEAVTLTRKAASPDTELLTNEGEDI